ncbi:hypothetical protein KMZ93_25370 [Bradyrhizobium sediminis]|uniref:Uncharacterized protein n=1 Tax=Bradyrhizobium sediminis TaxID=2840469 RepID=A0A975NYC2_9BRAD|nr:hypothetical protein [Bradyrhizobium sediminis]QWG23225.1 hypothetical protein KMZ93_25370 [Bradyrhizobium sediminis]
MVSAVQVWNPDDWEVFALSLLQSRHGALDVHKIPAAHKGDFGIDYYCTTQAVAYQCYVAQEPIDIVTRADRQKKKITTDIGKIVSNASEVSKLFMGVPIKHWILLTPVHDSKDVNLHCAKKTLEIRKLNCAHLDGHFEIDIHDQKSFPVAAVAAGISALTKVTLDVPHPTAQEMTLWQAGSPSLLANATHKLMKRAGPDKIQEVVAEAVRSFLQGNAILDALRSTAPDLHERVIASVALRSRRLSFAGPQGGPGPGSILNAEIENLIAAIKGAATNLSDDNAERIALGAVAEWIMRCPLDFNSDGV